MSKYKVVTFAVILTISLLANVYLIVINYQSNTHNSIGDKLLDAMYNFDDVYDLADNDNIIKELCTEDVYKKISPTNETKALTTYRKFDGEKVRVKEVFKVTTSTGGSIFYTLDTPKVADTRTFCLTYKLDKGKISFVQEYECLKFATDETKYDSIDFDGKYDFSDEQDGDGY